MLIYTNNQDISDIPIHFQYAVQRMGRLMMTGYNPQSDKMFRELFLPRIKEAIDLSKPGTKDCNVFYRAVAQSLGVKVQYIKSAEDFYFLDQASSVEKGYIPLKTILLQIKQRRYIQV